MVVVGAGVQPPLNISIRWTSRVLRQVHHTHYHVNFGQFFTFCDWYWGTLKRPEDIRGYRESNFGAKTGLKAKEN